MRRHTAKAVIGAPITTYLRGTSARQSAAHLRSHCDLVIRSPRVDILTAETGSTTTRRCWQQAIDAPSFVTVTISTGRRGFGAAELAACTPAGGLSRTEPLRFP